MKADVVKHKSIVADENYFETENLGQIVDIDSHLDFLKNVSEKYIHKKEDKKNFKELLTAAERKQTDKLLNMSVIGEFSGGKSTFINALMRSELLSACSLQGTTVANTVIEYSKDYSIKLIFKKGKPQKEKFNSLEELAKKVDEYTTDPEFTRNLHSVEIGIPSENIKDKFRIIDTPGTNSLELWHEEVTKNALREVADISVILMDSTKPFPQSLCSFVSANLEKILPQCVFVLTKFDLIPEKEQKMMLSYAKTKAESIFGLSDALILPFSSIAVLEGNEESEMYKLSVESEKRLLEFMGKKKTVAQLKKVISFADMLYASAEENIDAASKDTENQLALLMKTKQTDLSDFISKQKTQRNQAFLDEARAAEAEMTEEMMRLATAAMKSVVADIESQTTIDDLKKYVNASLAGNCQKKVQVIADCVDAKSNGLFESSVLQVLLFQDEFKKLFEELQILDFDFEKHANKHSMQIYAPVNHMSGTQKFVSNELSKENYAFFGGAAAGAAVGTVILPVVGTVIGAVAGFFAGGFFSPKIEKVRQQTIDKVRPSLNTYINSTCNSLANGFKSRIKQLSDSIEKEIDVYYTAYKETVDAKITEETNKKADIMNKINSIKADLEEVKNRKHILASAEKQIDLIGRKENDIE